MTVLPIAVHTEVILEHLLMGGDKQICETTLACVCVHACVRARVRAERNTYSDCSLQAISQFTWLAEAAVTKSEKQTQAN